MKELLSYILFYFWCIWCLACYTYAFHMNRITKKPDPPKRDLGWLFFIFAPIAVPIIFGAAFIYSVVKWAQQSPAYQDIQDATAPMPCKVCGEKATIYSCAYGNFCSGIHLEQYKGTFIGKKDYQKTFQPRS